MAYHGRRGPNVSEYIANLNTIPSAQEMQSTQENFDIDDDLAMFTNTQFFDFDIGNNNNEIQGDEISFDGLGAQSRASEQIDMKPIDFANGKQTLRFFLLWVHVYGHLLRYCDIHYTRHDARRTPCYGL